MGTVVVVLIGGTSHVGKSTVARALAADLGWRQVSTDRLARHPGRPWTTPRPQVHEHYAALPVDELTAQQLDHYRRMWPLVEELVWDALRPDRGGLVLEGSGVWPDLVAPLPTGRVAACWLTADDAVLRERVRATSGFDERTADERREIRKFLGRTQLYQVRMIEAVDRLGRTRIDVSAGPGVDALVHQLRRASGLP